MKLYELSDMYLNLLSQSEDFDEQLFNDTLESIDDAYLDKLESTAKVIQMIDGNISIVDNEIKRLSSKKKSMVNSKATSKRDDTIRKALETHSGSRSNAHWKNVQANEISFKVIEDTKEKILDLDSYINFSDIIGFDLYNFKPELMNILKEVVRL